MLILLRIMWLYACVHLGVCVRTRMWMALLLSEVISSAVRCMSLSFIHMTLLCVSLPVLPIMESRKSGAEVKVQWRQGGEETRVTSEGRLAVWSSGGGHQRVPHNCGFKRMVLDALQTQTLHSRWSAACMAVPLSPRGHSLTFKWSF